MQDFFVYSIASVLLVSLFSVIGIFTIYLRGQKLEQVLLYMVSFSAGALLGDALLHLIPEAVEGKGFTLEISTAIIAGIVFSFVIEKFVRWRHCHMPETEHHHHPFAIMNLVGDSVHNFIDGLIIAGSYFVSIPVGFATTLAVIFHEIPQEIGDFGVLLHGGFTKWKALLYNFLTALAAVLGALVFFATQSFAGSLTQSIVPFAAGIFIYIAGSDLIPELHKESESAKKSFLQLACILAGFAVMFALTMIG